MDRHVKLNYTSALDGSVLTLVCENEINTTDEEILHMTCHSNGSWIPNPAQFTCSSFTTVTPGIVILDKFSYSNVGVKIINILLI